MNLYCGVGGNRKNWDKEHTGLDLDITAIELNPQIAKIYQDFFPKDKVIVADAHQYLLEHYFEYDFIWSSPPCLSHSQIRYRIRVLTKDLKPIYPDMKLYEEIILLKYHCYGKWVVENTESYYDPLLIPQRVQRHYFWANFIIKDKKFKPDNIRRANNEDRQKHLGIDISKYRGINKTQVLRNCVLPELGLYIFEESKKDAQPELFKVENKIWENVNNAS